MVERGEGLEISREGEMREREERDERVLGLCV